MPLPTAKKRITFEEYGAGEFWIDYRPIGSLKYAEFHRMNEISMDKNLSSLDQLREKFKIWILGWNIPEYDDGPVLPLLTEDENSFLKLPATFVEHFVIEIIMEAEKEGGISTIPLASENSTNLLPFTSPSLMPNNGQEEESTEVSPVDSGQ